MYHRRERLPFGYHRQPRANDDRAQDREVHLSLKKVNDLLDKQSDEIVLGLLNPSFGFSHYLEAPRLGTEMINALVELIGKAFTCNAMRSQVNKLIPLVAGSNFLNNIVYLSIEKKTDRNEYNLKLIRAVIRILRVIFEGNEKLYKSMAPLKDRIEVLVKLRIEDAELKREFDESVSFMDKLTVKKQEREKYQTFRNTGAINLLVDLDPPEHFIEMSIVPKLSDIVNDQQPFLRKNITNGAYKSVSHYLDVQFRLLREDFLCPLREGVCELKKILEESGYARQKYLYTLPRDVTKKIYGIEDMHVYLCVSIVSCDYTADGVVYSIRIHDLKKINWERSKRLIYGSLICLSSDVFENNCIIGVVCNREIENLKNGTISVRFDYETEAGQKKTLPSFDETYIMLETTAYFESYRHVLDSLVVFEHLGEDAFPFRDQLVYCQNWKVDRPMYLINNYLDFRPLVDKDKKLRFADPEDFEDFYEFSDESYYAKSCTTMDESSWPNAEQMGLNDSQYDALKLALSNKLVLIQGPPGTGKTYLGVKLVQLLLHNRDKWWTLPNRQVNQYTLPRHKPILMICYTNHALDQFLEQCIKECGLNAGVVRVGGQCKTKSLEPFLLKNVKRGMIESRTLRVNNFHAVRDEQEKIEKAQLSLQRVNFLLTQLTSGVLNSFKVNSLLRSLDIYPKYELNDDELLVWLGFKHAKKSQPRFQAYQMQEYEPVDDLYETNLAGWFESAANLEPVAAWHRPPEEENFYLMDDDEEEEVQELGVDYLQDENDERMLDEDLKASFKNSKNDQERWNQIKQNVLDDNLISMKTILELCINDHEYVDGWTTVIDNKSKRRKFNRIKRFISKMTTPCDDDLAQNEFLAQFNDRVVSLFDLTMNERYRLYKVLLNEFQMQLLAERHELEDQFNTSVTSFKELRMQDDRTVMQSALIIAMTTTGAARYHNILRDIGPPIVIVEEAAEVFEAHIVSSLSKDCQHLILIGDHVQLRPNPTVYKLAKEFKVDVSLFERLLNNDINKVMLKCQHRMRPEISAFMSHFYQEEIGDDPSVTKYPNVIGLRKNMFYISHDKRESTSNEDKSKSNSFEAEYLAKLCQYLHKQNYDESKITILTMYLGQLVEVRKRLKMLDLGRIRVCTVDNYQGEENDIILLSLVRSNDYDTIGFLKIENRICVALSRARHGFYCIGNFEMLKKLNKKWQKIVESADKADAYGFGLVLTCGRHAANDIIAREPADFDLRPSGGCNLRCNYRLTCGHVCKLFCHTYDNDHINYKCNDICNEIIEKCGHYCKKTCGHSKACDAECSTMVEKKIDECGHVALIRCDQKPRRQYCSQPCERTLECGHKCSKLCYQACEPCWEKIQVDSVCKHPNQLAVWCSDEAFKYQTKCKEDCDETLECGHLCEGKCGSCFGGYIHQDCKQKCERPLICGHVCRFACSEQCPPCQQQCTNRCVHSRCELKCFQVCAPCKQKCVWRCRHKQCSRLCHEICDRDPCNQPCPKKLKKCGHPCIGLCGEKCPTLCRICDKSVVCKILFGSEDEPNARFIQLIDCHHIIEYNALDYWMQSRYGDSGYEQGPKNTIQFPECPQCKTQIRRSYRYSNYIKKQQRAIDQVKMRINKDESIESIKGEISKLRESISISVSRINERIPKTGFETLFKKLETKPENISHHELVSINNKIEITKAIISYRKKVPDLKEDERHLITFELDKIEAAMNESHSNLTLLPKQKATEITFELQRIAMLLNFFRFRKEFEKNQSLYMQERKEKIENLLGPMREILFASKIKRFDESIKEKADHLVIKLKPLTGVVTQEERTMIHKAMGFAKGHWFKCPNGHIYCIADCGGAMEKSVCPECRCEIGGGNHKLLESNSLASEMDGAKFAAWSETANNQANWDFDD